MKSNKKRILFIMSLIIIMTFCCTLSGCTKYYTPHNDENFIEIFTLAAEFFAGQYQTKESGWRHTIIEDTKKIFSMKLFIKEYNDVFDRYGSHYRNFMINNQYPEVDFFIEKGVAYVTYKRKFIITNGFEVQNLLWRDKVLRNNSLEKVIPLEYLESYDGVETLIRERFNIYDESNVFPPYPVNSELIMTFECPINEDLFRIYRSNNPDLDIKSVLLKTGDDEQSIIIQLRMDKSFPKKYVERLKDLYDADNGALDVILKSELFDVADANLESMLEYCNENEFNIVGFTCQMNLPAVNIEDVFAVNTIGHTKINLNKFIFKNN